MDKEQKAEVFRNGYDTGYKEGKEKGRAELLAEIHWVLGLHDLIARATEHLEDNFD